MIGGLLSRASGLQPDALWMLCSSGRHGGGGGSAGKVVGPGPGPVPLPLSVGIWSFTSAILISEFFCKLAPDVIRGFGGRAPIGQRLTGDAS